jgi:RNA polymerase sigma factor (sigma-70 family)
MTDNTADRRDEEFEAVVAHYEAELLRYVSRLLNHSGAVEDVVQGAFIRLHRSWPDAFRPGPQIATWLYRAAHNCAVDHMRRESSRTHAHERHRADVAVGEDAAPPPLTRGRDAAEVVREALQALDERERQCVILKVYEQKSYREIAAISGLSEGNVGYILHHAMKKLARAVRDRTGSS